MEYVYEPKKFKENIQTLIEEKKQLLQTKKSYNFHRNFLTWLLIKLKKPKQFKKIHNKILAFSQPFWFFELNNSLQDMNQRRTPQNFENIMTGKIRRSRERRLLLTKKNYKKYASLRETRYKIYSTFIKNSYKKPWRFAKPLIKTKTELYISKNIRYLKKKN